MQFYAWLQTNLLSFNWWAWQTSYWTYKQNCFLDTVFSFIITKILLCIPSYGLPDNSLHELGKTKDPLVSNCKLMYKLDLLEGLSHSSMGYSLPLPSLVSPHSPFFELQHIISSHHQIIQKRKFLKLLEEKRYANEFIC